MSKETDSEHEPQQLQYKVRECVRVPRLVFAFDAFSFAVVGLSQVIILGDGAVGKTSIAMRHTEDNFSNVYKQTIGLDFFLKRLALPGDTQVTLQIWDIGGQSIGGKMLKNYIFGAQVWWDPCVEKRLHPIWGLTNGCVPSFFSAKAVLLVYDITNYESFQNLEDWYRLVRRTFDDDRMPYVGLVGNKTDLNHLRAVKAVKHKQFAEENDFKSFFVSAKTGDQVNVAFRQVAADLAGIVLSKTDVEVETQILKAQIVNHEQNDPDVKSPDIRSKTSKCSIQ